MKTILILGANGATAQIVTQRLLEETSYNLKLYLRNSTRLSKYQTQPKISIIDGDVQDRSTLQRAMRNVDLVYSNIGGIDLAASTKQILESMKESDCNRLLFYSALGALYEVPGKFGTWNEQAIAPYLPGFRESHELIENEDQINTTEFRPAWLTDKDEINYEITSRNEHFKGTEVSRKSVADFVVKLIKDPTLYPNTSVGINKPGTDGDHPSWLN
ncbi:NAD(P)H-binding protein [Xylocopilactobacillus apis]|uniref:NAD-dependent dehydratase n=1 Tax=Xylocopilactobacillus apis TaxID=2932183 RepID=A0AAU9DAV1_9LACO|nr:NAD(P)H-binding protein [Xylocopilactobacillus apis]BDR56820.1 NAD-dependent dehydratase [Xylocopilactobacillus apis]